MLTRIVLVSGKSNLSSVYLKNFNVKEIVFPSKLKGPCLVQNICLLLLDAWTSGMTSHYQASPDIRFVFC